MGGFAIASSSAQTIQSCFAEGDFYLLHLRSELQQEVEAGINGEAAKWELIAEYILHYPNDFMDIYQDISLVGFERLLYGLKTTRGEEAGDAFAYLLTKQVPIPKDRLNSYPDGYATETFYYQLLKNTDTKKIPQSHQLREELMSLDISTYKYIRNDLATAEEFEERGRLFNKQLENPITKLPRTLLSYLPSSPDEITSVFDNCYIQ